jgi:hypothetical protein
MYPVWNNNKAGMPFGKKVQFTKSYTITMAIDT